MIPYGKHEITKKDISAIEKVLKSKFITQGTFVPKFENRISKTVSSKYAVAVNSATSALHIACLALGIKKGDLVWTSAISFVASANCAKYCNADVDFLDIDIDTFNISIDLLKEKLITAKKNKRLPKLIIVVHMCGQSCDMMQIKKLSKIYGFKIIEDASHALGGKYDKFSVGSCKYSDITIFSFHPVKIITSGEGGMATTNKKSIYDKLTYFRTHGITRNRNLMTQNDGFWHYEQIDLGYNYRMTDIAAALGNSQLNRLHQYVIKRNKLAAVYDKMLETLPLELPKIQKKVISTYHLYVIRLDRSETKITKKFLMDKLKKQNIVPSFHYMPIYRHPYYKKQKTKYMPLVNSEDYYSRAISIPIYPTMRNEDQFKVIKALKNILE